MMRVNSELRRLPIAKMVERHPDDGWSLAEPIALSPASLRAFGGLIHALIPPAPAPRPSDIEARVLKHVRTMVQYMPIGLRLGFVFLVRLLEWSPVWRFSALSRLSSLEQKRASRVLAGISTSRLMPLRLMMLAPKAIVLSTYFDQDEVHAALDYEPKGFLRERIARRDELLREEAGAQALAEVAQ